MCKAGCFGLSMLNCTYVRDKTNCLLYIVCLSFAGRVSIVIWICIYRSISWPNNSTEFGLFQLVPPPILEWRPKKQVRAPELVKQCQA